jgi:hypothetical protein
MANERKRRWPMKGLRVLALPLLAILSGCDPKADIEALRAAAVAATGGRFCDKGHIWPERDFNHSAVRVSADPDNCSAWLTSYPGVKAISGQIVLAGRRMPFLFYANRSALTNGAIPERIIVKIVGGPGIPIGPSEHDAVYLGHSDKPTIMISPAYSGTAHGSHYPHENFTAATNEIASLTEFLCRRFPNAQVLTIGESLGGPIAVSADEKTKGCPNPRNLLLISPMVSSPTDQLRHFSALNVNGIKINDKKSIRLIDKSLIAISIPSLDVFQTFFPKSDLNIFLSDRLHFRSSHNLRTSIILGSVDDVISPDGIPKLQADKSIDLKVINGMGHIYDRKYEFQIANIVDSLFEE